MNTSTNASKAAGPSDTLPMLYQALSVLRSDTHANLGVSRTPGYGFAAKINAVPIVLSEFEKVARTYPIVFPRQNTGVVMAILSSEKGRNFFVDDTGQWQANCYIPAYVRRYPFYMVRVPDSEKSVLCVDDSSDLVSEGGDIPLFDGDQRTDHLNGVLRFSQGLQDQFFTTADFVKAVEDKGLLIDTKATFRDAGLPVGSMTGFRMIDRKKLNDLNGGVIKAWLANGWLEGCLRHMGSVRNFDQVSAMRHGPDSAPTSSGAAA